MNPSIVDERTRLINGRISQIVLSLTQVGLLLVILYRAYVLQQPEANYNDIRIILGLSVFGNIFTLLYFGGWFLPVPNPRRLFLIYLGFTLFLTITLTLIYGFPAISEWPNTVLPAVLGPAIVIVLYYWIARLGHARVEKQIEE
ncbi:MAG: hypothetical protein DWQ07_10505 [Chloroflexi bacterium]|nr:MAG: hypothetical protein DWQ07_10505 [Chloroflexota bacterium]MBL1192857.1 hypothetical protein [Chloroflexota bacterium]NOH10150.1 hypothetical protein [Chloroflexota bacterium]